jgi:hypothetical protein
MSFFLAFIISREVVSPQVASRDGKLDRVSSILRGDKRDRDAWANLLTFQENLRAGW